MRVVHLIPQLRLGAGRYVVDLVSRQLQASWCSGVTVLTSKDAEPPFVSDPRLLDEVRAAGGGARTTGDFFHRELPLLIESARAVSAAVGKSTWVAHAHTAMAAAVAHLAGATAIVGTCHGVAAGRQGAFDLQDALAWRLCDRVTTPSRHWAERLRSESGVADPVVIPVGLDLARYPRHAARTARVGRPTRLVTVAELTARKGIDLLLDALPAVWERYPAVTCEICGDGDQAPALKSAAALIDPGGCRIVFAGHVPQPYSRLADSDIFVLPSRSDNQPVAAIEAMMAGRALVVTDVGGLGDLVRDGECGWVVPAESAPALADALIEACSSSRADMWRRTASGEAYARTTFDIHATTEMLQRIYEKALTRRCQPDAEAG